MANCGGLCLMVQPRMELNCINFCSANASQSFVQGACVSGAYLHRRKWDGTSSLSGSNQMMISKRLDHHRGDETANFVLSADTSRRNSRAEVLRRVIADRGTTTDEVLADRDEALIQDDVGKARDRVEYNWEEEWYPMYLTAEMPSDSPLGLTVFDRSLVLFYDGDGKVHCFEDRCPHRSAKLSEGQITDGNLECLYHGWQFNGAGTCVKIPQLVPGAKIPKAACMRPYEVRESQGVIWVWLSQKTPGDPKKLPWFEYFAREGWGEVSFMEELPYDYSILLENLMDPAHLPISHDGSSSAMRKNAQALVFEVTERTSRGFAGKWGNISSPTLPSTLRFDAPCSLRDDKEIVGKDGKIDYTSVVFLCRPAGQGKSMLLARFGGKQVRNRAKWIPTWIIHQGTTTFLEQDMAFLASQNETLVRENVATKDLYLNLKSSDTWVSEYRKWLDLTGHGMPSYFGHRSLSPSANMAVAEAAPAGLIAATASSYPAKGSFGAMFARDPTNRYFRHVVHCKSCLQAFHRFKKFQKIGVVLGAICTGVAITCSAGAWRATFVILALLMFTGAYACTRGLAALTQNFVRAHRR
ncbi:unnamed protein product [Sphagnum troendelagicum]|uniref:Rieske domain-containing protein n=1 Tax=Sphagnum troendelagicum TaxID=128251 RepID=A0ABP0TQU8_9BRYO